MPCPADDLAPTAIADTGGLQPVPGILTAGRDVAEVAEALHGTRSMARNGADRGSHPQRRQPDGPAGTDFSPSRTSCSVLATLLDSTPSALVAAGRDASAIANKTASGSARDMVIPPRTIRFGGIRPRRHGQTRSQRELGHPRIRLARQFPRHPGRLGTAVDAAWNRTIWRRPTRLPDTPRRGIRAWQGVAPGGVDAGAGLAHVRGRQEHGGCPRPSHAQRDQHRLGCLAQRSRLRPVLGIRDVTRRYGI